MSKYLIIDQNLEWEDDLDNLKKEKFNNCSRADMFRFLIQRGLESLKAEENDQSPTK